VPWGDYLSIAAHQNEPGMSGTAYKIDDTKTLPVCNGCHAKEHRGIDIWKGKNKDKMMLDNLTEFLRGKKIK
jgi:hypothetical protein